MSRSTPHLGTSKRRHVARRHVAREHVARRTHVAPGPWPVARALSPVTGFISLVGAGPGDPELLTRKAVDRLARADVVLYDALVDAAALDFAPSARRVFVGKRAGRPAVRQEFIHRLMIRLARQGHRVVRLKGGDPFVFGRGGEEALALVEAGVEFEVVPGISAALAAPALAGIPVTHRGVAASFLVVSGHAEAAYGPVVDGLEPHTSTLVVLMGLGQLRALAARLRSRGWSAETAVAVLLGASTAGSRAVVAPLASVAAGETVVESDLPGTIVIGDVVDLRDALGGAADGGHYRVGHSVA
jgi:uroporphyrin-III C-methyltransferase / precorrin-2 dehydrogenase / sirohydrochlorin ferrochelatase